MDPLDDLLRGLRANGAVLGTPALPSPYALRFTDEAALTLLAPLRGEAWIVADDAEPQRIRPGDVAVVSGPKPFVVTDSPDGPPRAPIDTTCDGSIGAHPMPGATKGTVLLAGAYHGRQQLPQRLREELPTVAVVVSDHDCSPLRDYLEERIAAGALGRHVGLDRLIDWLMVCTLRDWFEVNSPPWYQALGDDAIGPVLQALHTSPAAPWTLQTLAGIAGVSRTTFARRFTELVGEPPLAYLTDVRMTLAADLLAEPGATVAAVARQVGYADAFGFSSAFKRERGVSPAAYARPA
ncbi:AraC-like DNA-binding protein [Kribbella amoyensis]|uniref:AraC-like DNA-binding protein n=1 Tax=Kribbella amoyensis TaxID=996641 RepID=A0A561C000_9ACTN|nr:AraC family transcriptional regulator [Kribbella amoyensis]TWD84483.1 AraC-like DNA-binding protein [Kribbella amoyensis]